jgi:Restriction endonuclease
MAAKIFDENPETWQHLEDMVNQAFIEMGYESQRSYPLTTVRSTVDIDVHAVKTSTPIPTIVLCECKYWNKRVPQQVVHGFRTVCSDAGAHFGLIISRKGFQPGAKTSRTGTNVHLMDFAEFQETFFGEWRSGVFLMLAQMRDQLLPILRASSGLQESGLDVINAKTVDGIDAWGKYQIFFGNDGGYANFFILRGSFPATFNDPRGDPRKITLVTANSHRQYLEIAREAVHECTRVFNLPELYFKL